MEEILSELIEEVGFEVIDKCTESSDKITTLVCLTQDHNTNNKTQKSNRKITTVFLDATKSKTRVTNIVEITDMLKVRKTDKPSHPRMKKND